MKAAKLLFYFLIFLFIYSFNHAQTKFYKYSGNPILETGEAGQWDAGDIERNIVMWDGEKYRMWYGGSEVIDFAYHSIGYATSMDGITWERYSGNPVLEKGEVGEWDSYGILPGAVIFDGEIYKMWYFKSGPNGGIGLATSTDGINWNKDTENNPILTKGDEGSWDEIRVVTPNVIYENSIYKMWYTGEGWRDSSHSTGTYLRIGYAESNDGIVWEKRTDPVLEEIYSETVANDVGMPWVSYDGNYYSMYYMCVNMFDWSDPWYIKNITSSDGINWDINECSTVLENNTEGIEDTRILHPCIIEENGVYKMWYTAVGGQKTSIAYAEDFSNLVHPDSVMIDGPYIDPSGDPVNIVGRIVNPEGHGVDVKGMIVSDDGSVFDSLQLMDDGLNGDGDAGDGIYGGSYDIIEKNYKVGIKTVDQVTGFTRNGLNWNILSRFTGKGPIKFEDYENVGTDTTVNPGDRLRFNVLLKNYGITDTVYNVGVELVIADTTIEETTTGIPKFGNIASGESLMSWSRPFAISFRKNGIDCQPGEYEIGLKIKSNNEVFWFDSFIIKVIGTEEETWSQKADIPTSRCFASSSELDGKIYVIGGGKTTGSCLDKLEVYDPLANTWDTTKACMSTSRVELCVASVNGKIYAIGGAPSHQGIPIGTVEEYDPITDSWVAKTPMNFGRKGAACVVIDNKIYVAGGSISPNWGASGVLEVYDPSTDTWTKKANMSKGLYYPQGAVLDGNFYVIGGLIGSPWTGQKTVQKYDPSTDSWEYGPNMIHGRVGHTTDVVNNKIYAIGGDTQPPMVWEVEEYDPQNQTWTVVDNIPSVMNIHTSSVYNNEIFIFSGSTKGISQLSPTNNVYSFAPASIQVDVESDRDFIPDEFLLSQNYPNPFNPSTKISYSIPNQSHVSLKVFDVLGREIISLVNEEKSAGHYEVEFDGSNLTSGIYFYRIQARDFVETKKMVLMK